MQESHKTEHRLVYSGQLDELYMVWLKNLFLQIITFGIYRFWATTNMRRYLWSAFSLDGQVFEYTGTGGELFRSFLKVMLVVGVPVITLQVASAKWPEAAYALIFLVPFILIFSGAAIFGALRYRLTRTNWSGIRGGLKGSMWGYGLKWVGGYLLLAISLTLVYPWIKLNRTRDVIDNISFGNWQAKLAPETKTCFWNFVVPGFILGLPLLILYGMTSNYLKAHIADIFLILAPYELTQDETIAALSLIALLTYGIILLAVLAVFFFYKPAFIKEVVNHTSLGDLEFQLQLRKRDYFRIAILYEILRGITLGLTGPLITHWRAQFWAEKIMLVGELDLNELRQNPNAKPKAEEGLLEALDLDVAF